MKAILKVYSYKWCNTKNGLFDSEVGDGSIVYSLTGLIPEYISLKNIENNFIGFFRKYLSDDHYFNKKTYITCYCEPDFRPKFPS